MEFIEALEGETIRQEKEFDDLLNDFDWVKELNTSLANRYQEIMDCFPTVAEIDKLLSVLVTDENRLRRLRKFRSALIMLEKQDINIMPPKYEEIEK